MPLTRSHPGVRDPDAFLLQRHVRPLHLLLARLEQSCRYPRLVALSVLQAQRFEEEPLDVLHSDQGWQKGHCFEYLDASPVRRDKGDCLIYPRLCTIRRSQIYPKQRQEDPLWIWSFAVDPRAVILRFLKRFEAMDVDLQGSLVVAKSSEQ